MKSNKKSQLAIPLHWIFILVAGALILIFFVSIIFRQKAVSEQKIAITLASDVEEIFAGAGSGEGEVEYDNFDIPRTEITFICDEETGYSEYSIKGSGKSIQNPNDFMFSPDLIKGKELVMWSLPFNLPFKIGNFFMVTSDAVRYVVVYEDGNAIQDLQFDSPGGFTFDYIQLPDNLAQPLSIADEGYYKIKFIFVVSDPNIIPSINLPGFLKKKPKEDVSAITIVSGEYPHVQFYEYDKVDGFVEAYGGGTEGRPIYIPTFGDDKDVMKYAAIFAEDAGYYKCVLKKVFERMSLVAEIYKERTQELMTTVSECYQYYDEGPIEILIEGAEKCYEDVDNCNARDIIGPTLIEGIYPIEGIQARNEILKGQGCPLIY
jgi:hypothetical protein